MFRLLTLLLPLALLAADPARVNLNLGSGSNDGTGDGLRTTFTKINTNVINLWAQAFTNNAALIAQKIDATNGTAVNLTGSLTNVTLDGKSVAALRSMVPAAFYGATNGAYCDAAAATAAHSGQIVYWPAGTYYFTNYIDFNAGGSFVGAGIDSTRFVVDGLTTDFVLMAANSGLKDLALFYSLTNAMSSYNSNQFASTIAGISVQADNVTVENVAVTGFPTALEGSTKQNARVTGLRATNCFAWFGDGAVAQVEGCNNFLLMDTVGVGADRGLLFTSGGLNNRAVGGMLYSIHVPGFTNQAGATVNGGPALEFGTSTGQGNQENGLFSDFFISDSVGEIKSASNTSSDNDQVVDCAFERITVSDTLSRDFDRPIEIDGVRVNVDVTRTGAATATTIDTYVTLYARECTIKVRWLDGSYINKAIFFQAGGSRNRMLDCEVGVPASSGGGDSSVYIEQADTTLQNTVFDWSDSSVSQSALVYALSSASRLKITDSRTYFPSSFKPTRGFRIAAPEIYLSANRFYGGLNQRVMDLQGVTNGFVLDTYTADSTGGALTVIDLTSTSTGLRVYGTTTSSSLHTVANAGSNNLIEGSRYGTTWVTTLKDLTVTGTNAIGSLTEFDGRVLMNRTGLLNDFPYTTLLVGNTSPADETEAFRAYRTITLTNDLTGQFSSVYAAWHLDLDGHSSDGQIFPLNGSFLFEGVGGGVNYVTGVNSGGFIDTDSYNQGITNAYSFKGSLNNNSTNGSVFIAPRNFIGSFGGAGTFGNPVNIELPNTSVTFTNTAENLRLGMVAGAGKYAIRQTGSATNEWTGPHEFNGRTHWGNGAQIYTDTGSAGNPSILIDDDNSGFYRNSSDAIAVSVGGTSLLWFGTSGIRFSADNTYDIGASGGNRARDVYAARDFVGSGDVYAGTTGQFRFTSRGRFGTSTDGEFTILNNGATANAGLRFRYYQQSKTANYAVLGTESASMFHNGSASGTVIFTLPSTHTGGTFYTFQVRAAQSLVIAATNSSTITFRGGAGSANGYLSSATVGSTVTLVGNGTSWLAIADEGTWSVGGATSTAPVYTLGNPQLTTIELGHASDTTLARSAAGTVTVEGNTIITSATIRSGTGSPESAVTAPVGTLYLRTDGGAGTTLYVKESGTGNTGWAAK